MTSRLSICYAAPGHTLLSSAGSTRNILAVADALSEWADVTVAFRRVAEPFHSDNFTVIAMDAAGDDGGEARDDVAARGLNPMSHWRFMRTLRNFAAKSRTSYDLVFEKGWRLSGYLARTFVEQGVPAVLVENDARWWSEPLRDPRTIARFVMHSAAQRLAGRYSRTLPLIIVETEELKTALAVQRGVDPARVRVVTLGVDHSLFAPMSQQTARDRLGISTEVLVMLYVGGMDQYHDLSPLLFALASKSPAGLEVHLVGDGDYRNRYEALADGLTTPVLFHGQVDHEQVPTYISAADVCLAPYRIQEFYAGQVSFSTLKIPEYMACGRPVISVPSGNILNLVEHAASGLLFPNEPDHWLDLFNELPTREQFAEMGIAAAPGAARFDWSTTARNYLELGRAVLNPPLS